MGESNGIDSLLGGWAMPKAYSGDMRQRVIAKVESGASRRAAAEEFAVSVGVFPEINGAFARIDGWHVIRETIPPPIGKRTNVARSI